MGPIRASGKYYKVDGDCYEEAHLMLFCHHFSDI
jgi:hypothetical protein